MNKRNPLPKTAPGRNRGHISGGIHLGASNEKVWPIDRWLFKQIQKASGYPAINTTLWNGETIHSDKQPAIAHLYLKNRKALYRLILNPDLMFGDLYAHKDIEIDGNLVDFLCEYTYCSTEARKNMGSLHRFISKLLKRSPKANTLRGSKENIYHHYDIGNDFYRMWLDNPYMQYTCAYYPQKNIGLDEAQAAKLEHVCRKLELKSGETVVEAGCGWGGLARYLARHYNVKVTSYNISREQIAYARERAKQEGLADRITYVEDDYRNIKGQFDAFVSIGMLEHVGRENYKDLGRVVYNCLKPNGRGLIHSIGRNQPELMNAWIEKRIFPGAYPPSIAEMMSIFEPFNFSIQDVENLRLHYAQTLDHWLERFEKNEKEITGMFDETFVRMWRLYLAGSMTAFLTSELQLFQIVFTHAQNNELLPTRAHLYFDVDQPIREEAPQKEFMAG